MVTMLYIAGFTVLLGKSTEYLEQFQVLARLAMGVTNPLE